MFFRRIIFVICMMFVFAVGNLTAYALTAGQMKELTARGTSFSEGFPKYEKEELVEGQDPMKPEEITMGVGEAFFLGNDIKNIGYSVDATMFSFVKQDGVTKILAEKPGDGLVKIYALKAGDPSTARFFTLLVHVLPAGMTKSKSGDTYSYTMQVGQQLHWDNANFALDEKFFRIITIDGGKTYALALRIGDTEGEVYIPASDGRAAERFKIKAHINPTDEGATDLIASGMVKEVSIAVGDSFSLGNDSLAKFSWFEDVDKTMLTQGEKDGVKTLIGLKPGYTVFAGNLPMSFTSPQILRQVFLMHILPAGTSHENVESEYPEKQQELANMENSQNSGYAEQVLELVNQERAKVGARPLRMADDLRAAADVRARELTISYSHTRPDGSECFTAINTKNRVCGENIAVWQSSPEGVMKSWMNSPGHRANILNPEFREIGVGYYRDGQTKWRNHWVQIFRG